MALAPLALRGYDLIIRDPDCVEKSYPDFWKHLSKAGFKLEYFEEAP
jgi:3-phosphoshikimate 1-carboxyvinyltransferase